MKSDVDKGKPLCSKTFKCGIFNTNIKRGLHVTKDKCSRKLLHSKRLFRCQKCSYLTDRKNNLKRHIATMHENCDKVLECCDVIFPNKASLRDHVMLRHKDGYVCRECGRNFCRKALLKRHVTVHSGQKDYICDICGYASSHKSNLDRHIRRHNPKQHQCQTPVSCWDIKDQDPDWLQAVSGTSVDQFFLRLIDRYSSFLDGRIQYGRCDSPMQMEGFNGDNCDINEKSDCKVSLEPLDNSNVRNCTENSQYSLFYKQDQYLSQQPININNQVSNVLSYVYHFPKKQNGIFEPKYRCLNTACRLYFENQLELLAHGYVCDHVTDYVISRPLTLQVKDVIYKQST